MTYIFKFISLSDYSGIGMKTELLRLTSRRLNNSQNAVTAILALGEQTSGRFKSYGFKLISV